jgi:hypothetical protein
MYYKTRPLSLRQFWFSALAGLAMIGLILQMFGEANVLAAQVARNPQVIIAADQTPASCVTTKILSNPKTHKRISETRKHCAAGTIIGTVRVPLSEAITQHDAYVKYPPMSADPGQWRSWYKQLTMLIDAKEKMLHPIQHNSPATCTDGGDTAWVDNSAVILNDNVEGEVNYYIASDCSNIFLDTALLWVGYVPYDNAVWWIGFDYANYYKDCNGIDYELYPNTTYTFHPDTNRAYGDNARYDLDSQNLCFWQGGILKYLYVGPLN